MTYHVVPDKQNGHFRWAVKRSGNQRVSSHHNSKQRAKRKAKKLARSNNVSSVIYHRRDGQAHDSWSNPDYNGRR